MHEAFFPKDGHGNPCPGEWMKCLHCGDLAWRWFEATFMNTWKCPHCGAHAPGNVGIVDRQRYSVPVVHEVALVEAT